jgi:SnoaL-like protein
MGIHLPKAIDVYFASENSHDTTLLDQCFAANASVRDEGKTIEGLEAIKAWRIETGKKYNHTVDPLAMAERDGKVVVTGKVSGNFPGSPVTLDHIFEIKGGRIVSLEIR